MNDITRILIVEDLISDFELAQNEILKAVKNCAFERAEKQGEFLKALEDFQPDLILSDYKLPSFDGVKALELAQQHTSSTPFLIWSGVISEDAAVECMKKGASNYIFKENLKRLGPAVVHALEERQLLLEHKQAEEKYQAIFENSMEGIFQSTPQGRYISVNPALARIYGYASPREMIESVDDIASQIYVEPDARSKFIQLLQTGNNVENFETKNFRKDGSIIWTSTSARIVRDTDGNVLYYEGFLQDITERKQAEDALKNNEKRFRALIENGLDSISLLAADGTLLWESPAITRILDFTPGEFLGHNIFALMHPDDQPWTQELYTKLTQEPGSRQHQSFRLRHSNGTWRWVEAVVTNMLNEPRVNAIVVNYRDITERKQAEIKIQQRNDDLALINALNEVMNRGEGLNAVVNLLQKDLKRIFSAEGTTIYLLNPDGQSLKMQQYFLLPQIMSRIEKVIGQTIPQVEIPIQEGGYFHSVIHSGRGRITSDPKAIQQWMEEFVETTTIPTMARGTMRKLIPQIYKLLNIKSTIIIPLISDGKTLGLLDVSSPNLFTEEDLKRIENIGGHLTASIQRKQAEEALLESEGKYRLLFENNPLPMWIYDLETLDFLKVNDAAVQHYGYSADEFLSMTIKDIRPSEDVPKLLENVANSATGTQRIDRAGIWRHRKKDDTVILVEIISHPLEFAGKKAELVLAIDVTERKQAEEMLKDERNLLRTMIDNLPDRIYVMDAEGRKTISNTADWKASGGKTMEDVIGKTDFDTYPPELAEQFWQLDKAVLDSGQPVIDYEEPGLDPEGNLVSILTTKIPLRDDKANVIGLVGIGRDITERKLGDVRINDLLAFNEKILNHSPLGILTYKLTGECVFANENAASIVGAKVEELKAQNFHTIESWKQSGLYDLVEKAITTRTAATSDIHHVSTFGKDVWMTAHCITFKSKDEEHVLLSIADITERKQAEEKLIRSQRDLADAQRVAKIGSWSLDGENGSIQWSDEIYRIFGIEKETFNLTYETYIELVHPEDQSRVRQANLETLAEGKTFDIEYRIITPAGKAKTISEIGYAVKNSHEKVTNLFGTAQDITQRKQAEIEGQALLEIMQGLTNTKDLQELFELVHHSIAKVIYAENFFVTLYQPNSDMLEEIYVVDQYDDTPTPPAKLEKSISSYICRSGQPILLTQALFDELVKQGEVELVGTNFKSWLGVPLKTLGRTIGVIAVQDYENPNRYSERDQAFLSSIAVQVALAIERKQAEDELRRSHSLLYTTLESTADGILVVGPDRKISRFNRKFLELWRIPYALAAQEDDHTLLEFVLSQLKDPSAFIAKVEALYHSPEDVSFDELEFHDGRVFERYSQPQRSGDTIMGRVWSFRDITERKRAEEMLRESEERFSSAFEYASIGIALLTTEGQWFRVNRALCDLIGYSEEELFQMTFQDITHPDDLENDLSNVQQLLAGKIDSYQMEKRYFHKLGHVIWVLLSVSLVRNNEGRPLYFISQIQDITERKRAEDAEREQRTLAEALRDTAETLNSTLDYGEVLDRILAAAERVVPHNAATIMLIEGESAHVVRSHGYDKRGFSDEIMGIKLPLAETDNLRQMLETGQTVIVYDTYSYMGWKRLPITDWLRSNVGAPISIYGEVIGFILLDSETVGFFTPVHAERLEAFANQAALAIHNSNMLQQAQEEIAERRRAEVELRASEERFRQLADNIEEVFWMTDAETGRELYISPAAEKVWGRSLDYLLHEPNAFINSVFPEDQPVLLGAIEKERNGEKMELEYRIVQPDGSVRWIWDRAFPIFDDSSKTKSIAGISADITERREAELALIKSQSRYRELFDSSPISIWEEDFSLVKKRIDILLESGVTDLREYLSSHPDEVVGLASLVKVTDVNKAALELYGIEQKEQLLKELTQSLGKEALGHFHEEILGLMTRAKRFTWEGTDRIFDGRQLEVIVNGSLPYGYEEDWSKVIVSISDISERKRAEEETRRRAEETSALLETSLALTNLDLKAIMQSIGNSAKTLFTADGCRIFLMQPDGESLRCVLALQENSSAFSDLILKLGDGVTGAVAASGQAEIVNEMQNDPRAVQVPGTINEEEEAIMFAPLKERDRTIGVLSVRRAGTERPFQPADLELLEAFASMAASAVSNARLFEEAQQRLAELEALYENGLAVGQLLEPAGIGTRIIETFASHLSWHHVAIRLIRPETDDMELIAFNQPDLSEEEKTEMERHFSKMISKVGQGLSGWVVQTGKPLRTGNVHAHPQYVPTHAGIMSGLYMPLKVGERIIGCISVESEQANAFTEQDERLLATLANQAAIAFENARLYKAAHQEIFERKQAQAALWASETHYRALADSITDILFEMDHEQRYTHWNKASEMLTGIPSEDAIGRSMREVFGDSEEQTRIGKIYESVLKSRQAKMFETEIIVKGQQRAFEINAYPSTRGVAVVAKDVTERRLAETLMQKRFELMEFSARHSLDEVMQRTIDEVSDLTGSHIGFLHFVEADQTTINLQAWSSETIRDFCRAEGEGMHYPVDQAGVWADAVRQRRPLIQNDYESLPDKKGMPEGHAIVIREMVIPIIRNEKIVAVMGVGNKEQEYTQQDIQIAGRFADYAWDITERKQMESALADERNQLARRVEERTADLSRANSNLARALMVKDEFLANMSHELRTPLNAILGLSESLGEQVAGPLNEKQQKYLTTINESGHHLLALINDILDLAKIEAGQITLDINKVDVNSVCQASLRMIKQLAQKKDQEVLFEIDNDLGLMWADERRLKQMIVNLLSNAVKFTPETGKIGLEVHGDRAGNKVIITVWDNGIGISERDMNRLFRPFVQLDSGLAREATGTGLGLALVAQMARLHGGSINVISQPGEGSRFSLQLPWEPALAADPAIRLRSTGKFHAIDPNAKNKPTILLIEDTREVVMMLMDYLEMAGFKIVTAQDGVDGLAQAKLTHPDLILMDIQMPRMDGFETTQKLRSDPEFKDTPIIALTALAMPNDRQHCIDAGMDEYMSKPVNLKALVKMLHKFLLENEEANH